MPHCKTIIEELHRPGYRITSQREMIINAISHSADHLSAEEIFEQVQEQTQATNIATVYRTLDMLWEEGFANKNDLGEGQVVYAARNHGIHIHLVCRICDHVLMPTPRYWHRSEKYFTPGTTLLLIWTIYPFSAFVQIVKINQNKKGWSRCYFHL